MKYVLHYLHLAPVMQGIFFLHVCKCKTRTAKANKSLSGCKAHSISNRVDSCTIETRPAIKAKSRPAISAYCVSLMTHTI